MKTFTVEFQEIHRRCRRTVEAEDMDAAWDEADRLLPIIAKQRHWRADQVFVSRIQLQQPY